MRIDRKNFFFVFVIAMVFYVGLFSLHTETLAEPPSNFHEENAGSEENPFLIANLANLRWLSETRSVWGDFTFDLITGELIVLGKNYFLQTADIDASETKVWHGGIGFVPIGRSSPTLRLFIGEYDGNHFSINNLYVNQYNEDEIPSMVLNSTLFGLIYESTVKNVYLQDINAIISGLDSHFFGGLVASAGSSSIINCFVSGNIFVNNEFLPTYPSTVGGIAAGIVSSSITNSFFLGNIVSDSEAIEYGGLVGSMQNSVVSYSYVSSNLEMNNVGGLIGKITIEPSSTVSNNFWNIESTGILNPFNEIQGSEHTIENNFGKTTQEMRRVTMYIENGWDFEHVWYIHPEINDGYPFFRETKNISLPTMNLIAEIIDNNIKLTWNLSYNSFHSSQIKSNFIGFKLYRNGILLTETSDLSFTDVSADVDTKYTYFLFAVYESGDLGADIINIYIPAFYSPKDLDASIVGNDIFLTWKAPQKANFGDILGYIVYREGEVLSDLLPLETLFYLDEDVEYYVEYNYVITALYENPEGESEPSNTVKMILLEDILPPTDLVGSVDNYSVTLNWMAPDSYPIGYYIYRDEMPLTELSTSETSFIEHDLPVGEYVYSVSAVYNGGESEHVSVKIEVYASEFEDIEVPLMTELVGNFPNPFNPETMIRFNVAIDSIVSIDIYNIRGQRVRNLLNESMKAGFHQVLWNGEDEYGRDVGSGLYFYVMRTGDFTTVRRMVLLK
ncbi:MAG: T9SS type A sorting domain-containing protein [Candidatus Cloacimonetes bacterium]|nr:T9SS type A sorting domain-containing protein [Candidatus Cloacimonadota bacterium]